MRKINGLRDSDFRMCRAAFVRKYDRYSEPRKTRFRREQEKAWNEFFRDVAHVAVERRADGGYDFYDADASWKGERMISVAGASLKQLSLGESLLAIVWG